MNGSAAPDPSSIVNALTIDVEDYFQVSAFADRIARSDWDMLPCRVEGNIDRILELLAGAEAPTRATKGKRASASPADSKSESRADPS